jgi:hypothetical protein
MKGVIDMAYTQSSFRSLRKANGIYDRADIDIFNKIYRFGYLDPYGTITKAKEYLFFTKPDLHIVNNTKLNSELSSEPYFIELHKNHFDVIEQLQVSAGKSSTKKSMPFALLLTNTVTSNLAVPGMTATTLDTPVNSYGTSYEYRGSSEASDDNHDFSLEFRDNRDLKVYHFFRAYEEYEMLKSHGLVSPAEKYILNKQLHDMIGIYKFIVDEDYETILYYAYYCGVMFKSLPRDVFSNVEFNDGLTYSIDMKAAFVEDMNPLIINDFNYLTKTFRSNSSLKDMSAFDFVNDRTNYSDVPKCPYIVKTKDTVSRNKNVYRLKWRG